MTTPSDEDILTILQDGKLEMQGEFLWGSNYTFLLQVEGESRAIRAVYKPTRGERPLWDFPSASLAKREVAAFLVSQALGWRLVPATVYRRRAPLGPGSLQYYVEHDPEYHYFTFSETDRQRLRPVVVFDLLVNNADRKGSHMMIDPDGHLWLIDHGICFHVEDKLRTVLWDFAGEPIPAELLSDIEAFHQKLTGIDAAPSSLASALGSYLNQGEIAALSRRAQRLIDTGCFPNPNPNRRPYPWPPI